MYTPAVNNALTSLDGELASFGTAMTVADASRFPAKGWLTIGDGADPLLNEVIYYTKASDTSLTGLQRGQDGTAARTWADDSVIGITIIARHITDLQVSYGTTLERQGLELALTQEDHGRRYFDTDLSELFVWMGISWGIPVVTMGAERGIIDYIIVDAADETAVLAGNYRKGDRVTDTRTIACRVLVCKASTITHAWDDWVAIGRQL